MKAKEIENSMRDPLFKEKYGESWEKVKNSVYFWNGMGFSKSTTEPEWQWSETYNRWGAYVTLTNGWKGFTFPK